MQLREHDFDAAHLLHGVNVYRDSSSVVFHRSRTVFVQFDAYGIAVAVGYFVHTVVHYFPQNMVQTFDAGRSDIHTGAQTNGVQTFQHAYIFRFVFLCH